MESLVARQQHIDPGVFGRSQQCPVLQSRLAHVSSRYHVMMPEQSAQSMIEIFIEQDLQAVARLR